MRDIFVFPQKKGVSHDNHLRVSQELIVFLFSQFDCNVCGQTFCGSCSIKVKKAALGVTCKSQHYRPSAFNDSDLNLPPSLL